MHVKINRALATIALVLSIIVLAGVIYGSFAAWSAMQDAQNALTELGSTLGGTEAPAPAEVPSSEWYTNENGDSCYTEPEFGETICEPAIPE